jgi:hypothetical protein
MGALPTLRQQGIRIGKALAEPDEAARPAIQHRLELRSTLHQRPLSDVAAAPLHHEGIHACLARTPVQQCQKVGLARSASYHELAVDDAGADGQREDRRGDRSRIKSVPFLL